MAGEQTQALPSQVHVVDNDGNVLLMDVAQARQAVQAGMYRQASAQDLQELADQKTYGEGIANPLKAGAESALGTATFGLSREFANATGLTTPEAQAKRAKYNPIASEVVGPAVGIVGPLLAPELEGAGVLGELANPVKGVANAGQAITEAATPLAKSAAGAIAKAETSPVVNKIVSKALATGAGSAVEGAAYGLGQAVNEDALGNPEALGDKLMSHVGYDALLFGSFGAGIGAIAGGISGAGQKYLPKFLSPTEKAALDAGDLSASVRASEMSDAEKAGFFKGLTEQKPNAEEIKAAGAEIGAPVLESQTSASAFVQNADSTLINGGPPTIAAVARRDLVDQGFKAVDQVLNDSVGSETALSAAETGDILKKSFIEKFEQEYAPTKQAYTELERYGQHIEVNPNRIRGMASSIEKIIKEESLISGTPEYNLVKGVAEQMKEVSDLQTLKNLRTSIGRNAQNAPYIAEVLTQRLNNLEQRVIRATAESMRNPEAKKAILDLLDTAEKAKSGYRALREKMADMGSALGRSKFRGPQDFINYIDNTTPERFLKKIFAKDNSEFLKFFQKNFPEESEFLMRYQRGELARGAMEDGIINPKKLFKQLDKMSPELKNIMFKPEELRKLEAAKTWVDALPHNINPSGTDHARTLRDYFEGAGAGAAIGMGIAGPAGAIPGALLGAAGKKLLAEVRDKGIEAFVKAAGRVDPEGATKVAALASLERTAQKQTQNIVSSAKAIFSAGAKAALPATAVVGFAAGKSSDHKDLINKIDKLNSDPNHFIDHLDERTRDLYTVAPKTAAAVQQTAIRATQFLSTKAPKPFQAGPMSRPLPPSEADLSKFNLYFQTVEKPTEVLKHVAAGTLVPEHLETLNVVYPTLFNEMKSTVMEHLTNFMAKPAIELPYRKRQSLSMFLGMDLDGTLNPESIQTNQMAMHQLGAQQAKQDMMAQANVSRSGMGKINAGSRMLTAMQKTSQRENA